MTTPRTRHRTVRLLAVLIVVFCGGTIASHTSAQNGDSTGKRHDEPLVFEAVDIGGVDVRTGTLLLSGQEGGTVDGALIWTLGGVLEEGLVEVQFVVEVEASSLIEGLTGPRIAIAVLAYVVNETGQIVDHIAQGVILDSSAHAEALIDSGFKFIGSTRLTPGTSTLRVMVREQETGRFFLSRTRIGVSSPDDDRQPLHPPVFEDDLGNWVVAHQQGMTLGKEVGGRAPEIPSARPVLREGQPEIFLVGPIRLDKNPTIDASIVDSAGRVVADFPIEVSSESANEIGLANAALPPVDLPPGHFTLNVAVRDEASADEIRQSISVVSGPAAGPATWIGVKRARSGAPAAPAIAQKPEKFRRRRVRAAYLNALGELVAGNDLEARRAVAELETRALANAMLRNMRWIEDAAAEDLADQNPRSLLPVALLHQQMARHYVAHRQVVLGQYAREVAADRASEIGRSRVEGGFPEALLVNLANDLSRTVAAALGREYLESALSLNPKYRPALLALGASFERASEYDRATRVFRTLVETDPDNAEGRLRLAVNLARTGHRGVAARVLDDLLGRPSSEWIAVIAAQERARLFAARDRWDEALALLAQSIQRFPDDQRLRIQYSWLLDQSGRSLDAVEAILAVPPPRHEASARFRYGEWPDLGFEVSARKIQTDASAALPELAAALDGLKGAR